MKYFLAILGTLVVAISGSWLTQQGLAWYSTANIPVYAPSGWVIGLVWSGIFILSAIAAILWLNQRNRDANYFQVIWWFVANGILNVLWTYLFFVKHLIAASLVEMIGLEASVLVLIWLMWKRVRLSSLLLIPYAVWVLFATFLAYNFWLLN